MVDKLEIREIAPEDAPEIIEIHRAIKKGNITTSWIKSIEFHLRKKQFVGYVALKNGQLAGFIVGEIQGPSFGLEKSGWIIALEVHPHFMGAGTGKALIKSIFQYFREMGVRDIYTAIRWDAMDMLSFFISVGFSRSGFNNLEKHLDDAILK
ncbi:MAG: putative acetyltransferase [Syntrophus sp. PtaB.Bin001]|jgi:L-amino acid N-acyltransferase YncA|nr:MAG: putative acetyltransferase [Syntrophus sp. PtaB.Bin001]